MASKNPEHSEIHAFLELIRSGLAADQAAVPGGFGGRSPDPWRPPDPQVRRVPTRTRGFRLRLDLQHTKPPVWRRLDLPGDITLPQLHEVIQAAMGWTDSHLHRFRTGNGPNPPAFITQFDADEGDEGMREDGVRLDQLVAAEGDRVWYDYDFGDDWSHVLRVEKVLDPPPAAPVCVGGRLACPPEDCGGVWRYGELADWVRSDYDDAVRPEMFESAAEGRDWLPPDWHPDAFDVDETNALLALVTGDPVPVVEEFASLLEVAQRRGARGLRDTLARPAAHGSTEISDSDAASMTEPFRILLDAIGDGVQLTAAGYLKPTLVEQIAQRTGVTDWWIGKANREDLTWPIAELRDAARALGLVSVRKGRLAPTRAVARHRNDSAKILDHSTGRLPLGSHPADRQAGWTALAVVGSEIRADHWHETISLLLADLGWRDREDPFMAPLAHSPTFDVLGILAGRLRTGRWPEATPPAVAALARRVIQA